MPDDFKLVKSRKRGRRNTDIKNKTSGVVHSESGVHNTNKEVLIRKTLLSREEVSASGFYSSVLEKLKEGLELTGLGIRNIVCYGLGHFAECVSSRYQFGLLLALKDHFSANIFVYDPIFYTAEIDLLKNLGCQVILVNEEGKHKVQADDAVTLLYLPHCPKQLTNNFLWCNWGPQLKNCIIFSNSFSKIIESQPERFLATSAGYILNIAPYTEELDIDNSFKYQDIFNDIAVHIFPQKKLDSVPLNFWESRQEPKYSAGDTEFISVLKVEN